MDDDWQVEMMSVGVLLGQADTSLDMGRFESMEEFRIFLNGKYGTDITTGMDWSNVLSRVKTALDEKRYADAMGSI